MNCNSNTMPLIDINSTSSCNVGCEPKEINIVCKSIVIPSGQEVLAVQGENAEETRTFLIPKITSGGQDLSDKNFSFIFRNSTPEIILIDIQKEDIEELENYIKINFKITKEITSQSGSLNLQIIAEKDDFVWKTYSATFKIAESLKGE